METKIKEVQDYFKNKLLSGDFKIIKQDQYSVTVEVDSKYNFELWTANMYTVDGSIKLYEGSFNFINVEFNSVESCSIKRYLIKPVANYKKMLIEKKKAELNNLIRESLINSETL